MTRSPLSTKMAKDVSLVRDFPGSSRYGFHVTKVVGDDEVPPFAYTVGLSVTYGHPEVVIFGLDDDLDSMHRVLVAIEERIAKGEAFLHGARKRGLLEGATCVFARFPKTAYDDHLGQAVQHLGGAKAFSAVQCIWPDPKKRFPWDPKVMPPVLGRQPVFNRPDAGPRDPKWAFPEPHSRRVLTTMQVVTGKEPVRYVGRFDDGDYQFTCETTEDESDLTLTTLGWLVDRDPSLVKVADLERGEGRARSEPGKPFRKAV